ncbi:MAG: electron transport complex subunit E [Clostridia bacterium]|nr:electron transport complex subunit E [Clostridia bacterium]
MKAFFKKMFAENPVFVLLLGMCPTLGTSTSVINGLGMGLSATAVLICSNLFISLLRKFIPAKIRIASYIVIIAGFVTAVDMALKAYLPGISASLGVFIPLIVVNCIILARAESFASKNTPGKSAVDGLCMGLGFTAALVILSAIRELLGNGTLLGFPVLGSSYPPAIMMILPPGGFIVLGVVLGVINLMRTKGGAKHG